MTPAQRSLRARIGAFSLHAQGKTDTRAPRAAFMDRFEHEVDPARLLPKEERQKRALAAKNLYFVRLAFKSARAKKNKARRERAG